MSSNDLNTLAVPVTATGDYGINQPDNAWPGAAEDVVISMRAIGHHLYQTGWDRDSDGHEVWLRHKDYHDPSHEHPWSEWVKFPPDEAPAPPEE